MKDKQYNEVTHQSSMSASAFSLAFFGFLRVGEFTADKKSECGSHIIQFEDFSFVNSRDSTDLDLRKIHQNECITENLMIYDGYLNMFVTNEQGISNGQSYYI
jgi:hypothetical protein